MNILQFRPHAGRTMLERDLPGGEAACAKACAQANVIDLSVLHMPLCCLMSTNGFFISRRSFLKRCSVAGAAAGLPAWFIERDLAEAAPTLPLGPNDRPAIALVGCG